MIDRAWKIERGLVKLLLTDARIKEKFFDEIEGHKCEVPTLRFTDECQNRAVWKFFRVLDISKM